MVGADGIGLRQRVVSVTSKEIVKSAIHFSGADRLAKDIWIIPAARKKYAEKFDELLTMYPTDIARVENGCAEADANRIFEFGQYKDSWGITWHNIQDGYFGEAKGPAVNNAEELKYYRPPLWHTEEGWDDMTQKLAAVKDKFIVASQINPFERMQFVRGTEALYMDLAMGDKCFFQVRDLVWEYFSRMLDKWLTYDEVDAFSFSDDWGSQRALLISPEHWVAHFKPMYQELMCRVKRAGKAVFVHCDGYIMDLYPQFIELGVDAINSQLWCMDVEEIAARYAGAIAFWGEISRQDTLPNGGPAEIRRTAEKMKELFFKNGGGLIGQCEVGADVPLENIKAALTCWDNI